jgi:hypothetical protein
MTDPVLSRLVAADPASDVRTPETEIDALLREVLDRPAGRSRRAKRFALVAAIGVLSLIALVVGSGKGTTPSAAARAYAAAAPAPGAILHALYTTTTVDARRGITTAETNEAWSAADGQYREIVNRRSPASMAGRSETAVADGYVHVRNPDGTVTSFREKRPLGWSLPGERFREMYERGAVVADGEQFDGGRRLLRFVMEDGDARTVYAVDPNDDYRPVVVTMTVRDLRTDKPRWTTTVRISEYERVPDNPRNRANLQIAPPAPPATKPPVPMPKPAAPQSGRRSGSATRSFALLRRAQRPNDVRPKARPGDISRRATATDGAVVYVIERGDKLCISASGGMGCGLAAEATTTPVLLAIADTTRQQMKVYGPVPDDVVSVEITSTTGAKQTVRPEDNIYTATLPGRVADIRWYKADGTTHDALG